jgi:hypothetical protein
MLIDRQQSDTRMGTAMLTLCTPAFDRLGDQIALVDQLDLVVAG